MDHSLDQIETIKKRFEASLKDKNSLTELKKVYLSKDGEITKLLKQIKEIKPEQKAEFGKKANELKKYIEKVIDQVQASNKKDSRYSEPIDVTAPFEINSDPQKRSEHKKLDGSKHPLSIELEKILSIFYEMGFNVEESRQLDDDYHMFESLNFPKGHPARDNWDTFWTEEGFIPPAHTSTMQNRVLKSYDVPIRVVIAGRCYRNEATDASHEHTLHQIEGVYVDKGISMGDMIGTIQSYLEAFFEKKLEVKLQPAYFPFTEPDAEFLISCPFCNKKGCPTCGRSGWIEIMGCGMIHPNVLREGGIDPEKYSGFAWGFGLDRMVMIKYGIKDIRWLHSGDLSFLREFK